MNQQHPQSSSLAHSAASDFPGFKEAFRSAPADLSAEWRPDHSSEVTLHQQICTFFMDKINSGAWPAGMRLAPQRQLARQLGVNRSTLVAALAHLTAMGMIEGRRGGGTRVTANPLGSSTDSTDPAYTIQSTGKNWNDYVEEGIHYPNLPAVQAINRLEYEPGLIRLGTGEPAPELLPGAAMSRVLAELARQPLPPLSYEEPLGNYRLRMAVSRELSVCGIQADPASILITSGALQGLQLIALGLLPRGSAILLEKPSYLYSIHAFQSAGVKFRGLPIDNEGLIIDRLAAEARRSHAAMLYSIPTYHNPTGVLMSDKRRQELMKVTAGLGLPILEDGAYQQLWLDTPPPLPLKALDREGRVLHLGTLSKAASPGLRIGWIVGPEPVVRRLTDIKMQTDYGASSLSQLAAARWLEGGYHEEHLQQLRSKLRQRRDTMLQLLHSHFTDLASWDNPQGGYYIWLSLHKPLSQRKLFSAALSEGLLLNSGDLYDRGDSSHLRLSYAYASLEQMKRGMYTLAKIIKQMT